MPDLVSPAVLGPRSGPRTVLAVGCGWDQLPDWQADGYTVVRCDIEPRCEPDIVASMTNLGDIGPYDAVYCSHSLEHLYPHDVPRALAEFHRVLKVGGSAVILVPDLEDVPCTDDVLPGSHLCGLQLYYGDAAQIEEYPHMAHHSGFVAGTLKLAMEAAGFEVKTERMSFYNLMAVGIRA